MPTPAAVAPTLTLPDKPSTDGKAAFKGKGNPGDKVELWADGQLLGSTTVAADGSWTLAAALPAGRHTLHTRLVDASGKVLAESAPVEWEMPAPAVAAPTLTLPDKIEANKPVTLSGSGTPGEKIEIVEDGKVLGVATVGADGTWSYEYTPTAGEHTLNARMTSDPAAASTSVTLAMPAGPTAPAKPDTACGVGEDRGSTYVVARCEYMSLIATRTNVATAALIAANPQVANPNLIYPGQILNLPPR